MATRAFVGPTVRLESSRESLNSFSSTRTSRPSFFVVVVAAAAAVKGEKSRLFSRRFFLFFFYFSPPAYIVDSFADRLDRLEVFPRGYRSFPPLLLPLFFSFERTNERMCLLAYLLDSDESYRILPFFFIYCSLSLSLSLSTVQLVRTVRVL